MKTPADSDDGGAWRDERLYALHISRYAYTHHTLTHRVTEKPEFTIATYRGSVLSSRPPTDGRDQHTFTGSSAEETPTFFYKPFERPSKARNTHRRQQPAGIHTFAIPIIGRYHLIIMSMYYIFMDCVAVDSDDRIPGTTPVSNRDEHHSTPTLCLCL
jgi:hypothetical protein